MNIRFYNARILTETMDITEGELWVRGNTICYIGDGEDVSSAGRVFQCVQARCVDAQDPVADGAAQAGGVERVEVGGGTEVAESLAYGLVGK